MILLVGSIFHMTRKIVSEMTYNVSMGTLNPTIPYHTNKMRIQTKKCGVQNGKIRSPTHGIHYGTVSLKWRLYVTMVSSIFSFSSASFCRLVPGPHWELPSPDLLFYEIRKSLKLYKFWLLVVSLIEVASPFWRLPQKCIHFCMIMRLLSYYMRQNPSISLELEAWISFRTVTTDWSYL